ncbi:hypothetical protein ILUMI_09735, partial [Ignelater luminosus]
IPGVSLDKKTFSAKQIADLLNYKQQEPFGLSRSARDALQLQCSPRKVRRYLHSEGLYHRRPATKVDLIDQHAQRRLAFTQQNLNRDWGLVIVSDEKFLKPIRGLTNHYGGQTTRATFSSMCRN